MRYPKGAPLPEGVLDWEEFNHPDKRPPIVRFLRYCENTFCGVIRERRIFHPINPIKGEKHE